MLSTRRFARFVIVTAAPSRSTGTSSRVGSPTTSERTALETLVRTDLVDDRRYAERRAQSLADRGAGNALIRHELARAGLDPDVVDDVLASLRPERERAEAIVARRGAGPKTARYLAGKGFSYDVVESFIAQSRRETLG